VSRRRRVLPFHRRLDVHGKECFGERDGHLRGSLLTVELASIASGGEQGERLRVDLDLDPESDGAKTCK
jgi:hypothetical protein